MKVMSFHLMHFGRNAMSCPCWVLRSVVAVGVSLAAISAQAADAALIDAAKKEGEVVWYTTQIIAQLVRPVSAAFEKKYSIKVRSTRANSTELSVKIINESRAGKPQSDVFDGTSTVVPLKKEGFVLQWLPDPAKAYPAQYKDPEGYWVANNLFFLTPGFNTALVPKGTEPRSYQALLDPKWRGKIAWSTAPSSSGGPGFIGTVLTEMGTESGMLYLRELSKQKIANIGSAAREVLDQVIAGEYLLALQIFNHHTVISAKKGAPSTRTRRTRMRQSCSSTSSPRPKARTSSVRPSICRPIPQCRRRPRRSSLTKATSARISSRQSRPRTTSWHGRRSTTICFDEGKLQSPESND
jgi:iron(III) transport system substrate-binding protein